MRVCTSDIDSFGWLYVSYHPWSRNDSTDLQVVADAGGQRGWNAVAAACKRKLLTRKRRANLSYKPLRLACLFVPKGCTRSPVWEAFTQESAGKTG